MEDKIAFIDRWLSRGTGLLPCRNDGQHGPLDGWSGKIADPTDRERLIDADIRNTRWSSHHHGA